MTVKMYPYIHDIDAKIHEANKKVELLRKRSREGESLEQEIANASGLYHEYLFYKILHEDLPEDWVVFYNLNFEFTDSFGNRVRRQLDFLLVAPECGIYNLECKGHYNWNGTAFYLGKDPNNTRPLIDQCKTAVRDIVSFFKCHGNDIDGLCSENGRLNLNVGGAIAFPSHWFEYDDVNDISASIQSAIGEFGTGLPVLDAYSMKDGGLEKYVRDSARNTSKLSKELAEEIVAFLTRSATAKMKLNESNKLPVSALSKQMDGLVQSREELLPLIVHSSSQYMYITGGAGTGKTWLAKSYVKQYAASHKDHKILFICFNRLLAALLRLDSELSKIPHLNIVNIHATFWEDRIDEGYRGQQIKIAPLKPGTKIDFNKTGDDLGYSMQDCLNPAAIRSLGYDCIVVDEAQDLCEGMFAFLMSLLRQRDKGKIFICAGNEQNIYKGNEVVKASWFGPNVKFDSSNTLRLTRNLRNSVSIHRYCKIIVGDKNTQSGVAYKGSECQIEKSSIPLAKLIENLKEREGLENRDIAVLTDKADALDRDSINGISWVRYQSGLGDLNTVSAQLSDWQNNKGIWLSTLHAFKGLEAACVIVYLKNKNTDPIGVYVATTRAKYRLIIMPNDTGLRVDKPGSLLKSKS